MSTTNAILTNAALTAKVSEAALTALKAGMTKDEVLAVLARLVEAIENSDDE
jgi:outer membrane protein assembly factor BamE (lipoprotein component of BamABCDE complex)